MKLSFLNLLLILAAISINTTATAQVQTVGLFVNEPTAFVGYTLFAPVGETTYLIDNKGRVVHTWLSEYLIPRGAYILDNGHLLRPGYVGNNQTFYPPYVAGETGIVQEFDWEGNLVWEFEYSNDQHLMHHDVKKLPNGNVLMITWEFKSYEASIEAGADPHMLYDGFLFPEHIIEVDPDSLNGTIVWEWHVWDHLIQDYDPTKSNYNVVADHPELIDLNYTLQLLGVYGKADFNHINSVDYNQDLDQIVMSVRAYCEIWIIDHSTTTEEAASHTGGNSGKGGDLLYRWGNPATYRAGTVEDQQSYYQHDAQWIPADCPGAGNITFFNNGPRPNGQYSSVDEIVTPIDSVGNYTLIPGTAYEPEEPVWRYIAESPTEFYSRTVSGARRLPNGNTLVCSGDWGILFQVTPDANIVWYYINPVIRTGPIMQGEIIPPGVFSRENNFFKVEHYKPGYAGFYNHILIPGDPIELYPTHISDVVIRKDLNAANLSWSPILNPFVAYYVYTSNNPLIDYLRVAITYNSTWSTIPTDDTQFYRITFEIAP